MAIGVLVAGCSVASPVTSEHRSEISAPVAPQSSGQTTTEVTDAATAPTTANTSSVTTTQLDGGGKRPTDPLPPGTAASVGRWSIVVTGFVPDATETVVATNPFNDPPAAGNQYVLVEVSASYRGEESEVPALGLTFSLLGESAVAYDFNDACRAVHPDPLETFTEVFPGGTARGNLCWEVASEDIGSLVLIVDAAFSVPGERLFLGLPAPGDTYTPAQAGGPDPTLPSDLIPPGQPVGVGDWDVTVVGFVPDATETVVATNPFNDPPADGNQYVLVEVAASYRGEESEVPALGLTFSLLGESAVAYDFNDACRAVHPDPLETFTEVFPGGTARGNLCWEVASEDIGSLVLIVDEALAFDQDRIFYELPH